MDKHFPYLVDRKISKEVADQIDRELSASFAISNEQATNTSFVFAQRDEEGELNAGLTASTSYGWLLIKTLWVAEELRGEGRGKTLVKMAEQKGRAAGCHSAWLDTSSPDAHRFYEKIGYRDFGMLQNGVDRAPAQHCRWFMKKEIISREK